MRIASSIGAVAGVIVSEAHAFGDVPATELAELLQAAVDDLLNTHDAPATGT